MFISGCKRFVACFAICLLYQLSYSVTSVHSQSNEVLTYEVKSGDTLSKIAAKFGNIIWWLDIYQANREKIENPDVIYPGQELSIPPVLVRFTAPLNSNQFAQKLSATKDFKKTESKESEKKQKIEKFREAFSKVVEAEKKNRTKETAQEKESRYQGLGLGGLILDETRSKMGSNFYSVFYKQWTDPQNVQNFTVTVSEQPMPSRGTMVQVKIDNQLVYRSRLEPRYYKTEQAAKKAVRICQRKLKRIATMDDELAGY